MKARPTAAARREVLRRLLERRTFGSQAEIEAALERLGHRVTQTTVSRDLAAIGAVKEVDDAGELRYVVAGDAPRPGGTDELARILRQFAVGVRASVNLAVVRTLPGAAAPVAAELDRSGLEHVLGTVAGDDTILVVGGGPSAGERIARDLHALWHGRAPGSGHEVESR